MGQGTGNGHRKTALHIRGRGGHARTLGGRQYAAPQPTARVAKTDLNGVGTVRLGPGHAKGGVKPHYCIHPPFFRRLHAIRPRNGCRRPLGRAVAWSTRSAGPHPTAARQTRKTPVPQPPIAQRPASPQDARVDRRPGPYAPRRAARPRGRLSQEPSPIPGKDGRL